MPKIWSETIEAHRRVVRDSILDAAAALTAEYGLRAVTMSQIAAQAGIGRATLYKYFPDIESILSAWHEREIAGHLEHLADVRNQPGGAIDRLQAVLAAYALISHETQAHHETELGAFLHRDGQIAHARQRLRDMIEELIREGTQSGEVRDDTPSTELAAYCLHALSAAGGLRSKAAVNRLVAVTVAGLRRAAS